VILIVNSNYFPPKNHFLSRKISAIFVKYGLKIEIFGKLEVYLIYSGDRIPVEARFFAQVQTGPGAHPASCTMGKGSFLGVKAGADQPPPPSAEVENE
jgi:hypothetical protein